MSHGEPPLTAEAGVTKADMADTDDTIEVNDSADVDNNAEVKAETTTGTKTEMEVNAEVETQPGAASDAAPEPEATPAPPDVIKETAPWPEGLRDPYPASYPVSYEAPYLNAAAISALPNDKQGWYYIRNKEHQPPTAQQEFDIRVFDAHYLGDITQKRVYLTFDEGYENGFTTPILDILKEKNVTAAFFMTKTYIRDNPALAARISADGHVAANHSVRHISFPSLTDEEIFEELTETARYFEEITGYSMSPFVRPPSGDYSVRSLAVTQASGYQTVFWSFAHEDWLVDQQPGKDTTFTRVMDNLHNGAIILLHAVSASNTEALPDIIDAIHEQGYTFGNLNELLDAS